MTTPEIILPNDVFILKDHVEEYQKYPEWTCCHYTFCLVVDIVGEFVEFFPLTQKGLIYDNYIRKISITECVFIKLSNFSYCVDIILHEMGYDIIIPFKTAYYLEKYIPKYLIYQSKLTALQNSIQK